MSLKSEFYSKGKKSMSGKASDFENFEAALKKLMEFKAIYDGSEIHRAGMIQAFEFTFEQCWKAVQKRAGKEGVVIASPRKALEWAMTNGWISPKKENIWLDMLSDRNLTSHTYRDVTAAAVATRVLKDYSIELQAFLSQFQKA